MKKVTLKELVAGKIIFAVLVALYYWMWARNTPPEDERTQIFRRILP